LLGHWIMRASSSGFAPWAFAAACSFSCNPCDRKISWTRPPASSALMKRHSAAQSTSSGSGRQESVLQFLQPLAYALRFTSSQMSASRPD
jgi:hypothetical protein